MLKSPNLLTGCSMPAPKRVLIVDDNVDSAQSLQILCQVSQCEVAVAHDGLTAVELARQFQPELVILDLSLPRLSGLEACRQIRQLPHGATMTIVAVTGWSEFDAGPQTQDAGFTACLTKPVDLSELEALLA